MAKQKEVKIDPVSKPFTGPLTNAIVSISPQKCVYEKKKVRLSTNQYWESMEHAAFP